MAKRSALDKLNKIEQPQKNKKPSKVVIEEYDSKKEEEALLFKEEESTKKKATILRRKKRLNLLATILLVVFSMYFVFLIYGVLNTSYVYDENGKVVPQVMTVEKLQELDDFNALAKHYRTLRNIYEEILTLDYRIAAGVENPQTIAPLYNEQLKTVESIIIDLQAQSYPAKYTQIYNMLLAWAQTDVGVYLQRMPQAITYNNKEYAQTAVEYRNIMYNDFSIVTSNLISMGKMVYGAELEDIAKWSPEKFISENIG